MGKHLAKRHYIIAILLVLLLSLTAIAGISFALPEAGTVYAAADTGHEVKLVYRYYTVNGTVTSYAVTAVSYDENAQLNKDNLKIVIPATYQNKPVTEIDDGVFSKANNSGYTFTSLDISSATNLKKIGATAFKGQTSLTGNLTIPNSVTSIGASAFMGCTGFTGNLTIPDSVTKIDFGAFNNCTGFRQSICQTTQR